MARPEEGKQYSAEYNALIKMNEDLCNALPIDDLLPKMISKRVIDFREKTDIREEGTDRKKVDLFISKLTREMITGENGRFYKLIEAMKESSKCDFLVRRMEGWIGHYQKGTPPPLQTAQLAGSQSSVSQPTSQQSPVTVTQDHDGHPITDQNAKLMHKHVIPRISAEWETVAAYLEYNIATKRSISKANRGIPKDCCIELLEDWITTDNGVKPKTWEKFIEVLSDISSLAMVTKQIKQCLCEEGILRGQRTQQMMSHQQVPPPVPQQSLSTEHLDVEKILELQKEVFTNCQQYIVNHLSPDDVVDIMISKRLIGDSASQQLCLPIKTTKERNRIIVNELSRGGPGAFEKFCAILKKNRRMKHIADHLEKEWGELLQSSQHDIEQPHDSPPPVHTKVATALPQANRVTTTTNKQQKITAPQQTAIIQETTIAPAEQGHITAPSVQAVLESHERYEDSNSQEVTSPVSESEEGYFQSTGIDLVQGRNGQLDKSSSISAAIPPPDTTTTAATINTSTTSHITATPDDVTTTTTTTTTNMAPAYDTTAPLNVTRAPTPGDVTHSVSDEDSLVTGKDSKRCMRLMRIYVIPKISEEWEAVAAFLDYSIQAKDDIKKEYKTPRECCTALLEDWVTTDNGVKPKTWKNLIEVLSDIEELESVIEDIKQCLISEGVALDGTAAHKQNQPHQPFHYNLEDQKSHNEPHQSLHNLGDQSTDNATDLRWNQQPESSVNTMAESELLQSDLNNHPSYNLASVDIDQRYGRQMGANQPPQPIYRQQPHAFIVYAKEEYDPRGEQVLCLSNLLHNSGINCDIDLYYIDENNVGFNWPYWVEHNLREYTANPHCCVILVCSPTMISLLDERNANAHVEMVAAHFDSLVLGHFLQYYAKKFLPLLVNDPSTNYVPPSLSRQICYYFPYYKLNEMPENVSTHAVLNHPDFASLKSLVDMLTRQQETPAADVDREHLVAGGAPPTDANTTPNDPGTVAE